MGRVTFIGTVFIILNADAFGWVVQHKAKSRSYKVHECEMKDGKIVKLVACNRQICDLPEEKNNTRYECFNTHRCDPSRSTESILVINKGDDVEKRLATFSAGRKVSGIAVWSQLSNKSFEEVGAVSVGYVGDYEIFAKKGLSRDELLVQLDQTYSGCPKLE